MDSRPIGLLDSGIGGLSIWRSVRAQLPHESMIYIGDHKYNPYHEKTQKQLRQRVCNIITYLHTQHVKLIVIACNTATVMGIDYFRKKFPNIPIIGIVPVVKTAALISTRKRIGILSTASTAKSAYLKHLIKTFAVGCVVSSVGSRTLSSLIERGIIHGSILQRAIMSALRSTRKLGVDVVALGCSHYPFIEEEIRKIMGKNVTILDSGGAVARHVERILMMNNLMSEQNTVSYIFHTTGDASQVSRVASQLLGKQVKFRHVTV